MNCAAIPAHLAALERASEDAESVSLIATIGVVGGFKRIYLVVRKDGKVDLISVRYLCSKE